MKNRKHLLLGTLIAGITFMSIIAGCASTGAQGGTASTPAKQLAADLNAIKAGSATAEGATVKLTGDVGIETALTVPAGVTLDVTADAALGLGDVTLTVNGTVIARSDGIRLENNAKATIDGSGTIRLNNKGCLLSVDGKNGANPKLTLDGVTLVGIADNTDSLVQVWGGEFVLKSGAITGNAKTAPDSNGPAGYGSGVFVGGGTTFTMEGGTISGNSAGKDGGGVCTAGNFIMKGGVIFGNSAGRGGGVACSERVDDNYSFTMEGGRIQGNTDSDGFAKNTATSGAAVAGGSRMKWGTGGTYTKGGVSQTGGSVIEPTGDTLIAIPAP